MPEERRNKFPMVIIGLAILIALGVGGYFVWNILAVRAPEEPIPEVPIVDTTSTYASSTLGILLEYPNDFTVNESYTYDQFGQSKLIHGVKFTIPASMATGTNLSSDTGLSIEWLPRARVCSGDIYVLANVRAMAVTEGAMVYSVASSSDAGAGNVYEEIVYAIASSTPCTAVRYFIHSTQMANYPAGSITAFDRAVLIAKFDEIRRSVVLQQLPR